MVQGWAERTPDGFTMHIKAFGLMTRHPVKAETIPPGPPRGDAARRARPRRPAAARAPRRDLPALPRGARAASRRRQARRNPVPAAAVRRLQGLRRSTTSSGRASSSAGDEMLVEFRHRSWLDDENRAASLAFLERIGAGYVVVDAPRSDTAKNLVPTVVATTSPTAYVRFHGRNLGTWNKRGGSAAERFDYLYSDEELGEWIEPLRELAGQSEQAYAFFNNNASSEDPDNPLAPRRAGGDERAAAAPAPRREPDRGERRSMNVLSIVHGEDARRRAVRPARRGGRSPARRVELRAGAAPPRRSTLRRGARLRRRDASRPGRRSSVASATSSTGSRGLIARTMPTLGICLGSQLLAQAAGAWVGPLAEPEIGWCEVELTEAGAADPVLSALPARFERCSGTTTATDCPTARSRSRTTRRRCRLSGSATPAGASSSTRR